MLRRRSLTLLVLPMLLGVLVSGQPAPGRSAPGAPADASIDRDLLDVTVAQLHRLYAERKYTVTQVVQWHLARIDRYNGVYGAIETVLRAPALAEAARQDAAAAPSREIDRDLMDVTVPRLQQLYADRKYTVMQVVRWHLDRIDRYNPI